MTWRYSQKTGDLIRDGIFLCRGYSGYEEGKNNPAMQTVHDMGPIPVGKWIMAAIMDSPAHGPRCIRLVPDEGTMTWGRDGFLIHGDSLSSPGNASHGCIVINRTFRELVWGTKDCHLEVVP
jgi:hypothetical protein